MFKLLYNSKLLVLLLLIISLFSCYNNKTKRDAFNESIAKFKDALKPIEIHEYIPKEYSEVVTDTLLANGFRVKIKTYTSMDKSVTQKLKTDAYTIQTDSYRDWISEVKIEKDGKLIWNETIDEAFFIENGIQKETFLSKAINLNIQLDEQHSIEKDSITLIAGYVDPFENNAVIFNLKIDTKGNHYLKKLSA